jgi:hypothetical protein
MKYGMATNAKPTTINKVTLGIKYGNTKSWTVVANSVRLEEIISIPNKEINVHIYNKNANHVKCTCIDD